MKVDRFDHKIGTLSKTEAFAIFHRYAVRDPDSGCAEWDRGAFEKGVEDMVLKLSCRISGMGFTRGFSKPSLQSRAANSSSHPSGAMTDRGPRGAAEGAREAGRGEGITPRPPLTSRTSKRSDIATLSVEHGEGLRGGGAGEGGGDGGQGHGCGVWRGRLKVKAKGAVSSGGFEGICARARTYTHTHTHRYTHTHTHTHSLTHIQARDLWAA